MHLVRIGCSPAYLADMMTATADLPSRERLLSAQGRIYHGANEAAAPGPHQNRGPHHKDGKCHVHFMNMLFFRPYFEWNLNTSKLI